MDKALKIISFSFGALISVSALGFCFYKLCTQLNSSQESIYVGIMCSIISLYVPSPIGLITNMNSQQKPQNIV